jgi:2-polyprenyl-3-methyl-5-hydroxy-6-metoxy-1,4-benzoquinol methylase
MLDNLKSHYRNDEYDGYCVHAYPGLHAKLEKVLISHAPALDTTLLDLGCGSGAWGKRMTDLGFEVTGVDIETSERPFKFINFDLNTDFGDRFGQFSVVTAIELIEHIENPRHFLRQVRKCLRPGGIALISTPNASSVYSRPRFMLTGQMASFTDLAYRTIGHITPITKWQMEKMVGETGMEQLHFGFADASFLPPRSLADFVKIACWCLRPFMLGGPVGGQSMIVVLRRQE